jgi:hypothetical protein
MKKHKISFSTAADFFALALVSPERDYKLCFLLNKALHINLDKAITVYNIEKKSQSAETQLAFPAFIYFDEAEGLHYYIIKNNNEGKYMLPQMKQVDYLFLLKGSQLEKNIEKIKKTLTDLPYIHSTFAIPNSYLTQLNFDRIA